MRTLNYAVCLVLLTAIIYPTSTFALADNRLDPNVAPTFQTIELDLDANRTEYSGHVQIELDVKSPTKTFRFHGEEMTLDRVELLSEGVTIELTHEIREEGLVVVTTNKQLRPGKYSLRVDFSKDYNTRAVGLYRMEKDGQGYLFTQLEAVDARKAFPCWDEPSFKIPFQATVRIPKGQEIVTNTPVEREYDMSPSGFRRIVFRKTKPMSTYLIAFAAGPLESVPIVNMSIPGRVYTVKGQKHLAKLATEMTAPILEACEKYFDRPYPYAKLDLIAIPEYWPGAMENVGAVTFADGILLIDSATASVNQKRTLALVTAHELAHMWFGDLVTMAWWDDLWLNESFADWMGEKITDQLYPEFKTGVNSIARVQDLLGGDARPSTTPVRKEVNDTSDIMEDLGLAYGKGRQVLHMVEQWIGEEKFRRGVIDYINKHAWGNTVAGDLFAALSKSSGQDLTPILSTFLDQPGFPMITAELSEDGALTLSQKRFLNEGVEAPDQTWAVPIRVKYADGSGIRTESVMLDKEKVRVKLGDGVEWFIPDAGAYGYYRWRVPKDVLVRIAADPVGTLTERERAAFVANTKALLEAGEMRGDEYLEVLAAFGSVPKPEIVSAVMNELGEMQEAFITEDLDEAFSHYVRETLRPALETFGLQKAEREDPAITALRPRLLRWMGTYGGSQQVQNYCEEIAKQYIEDPGSLDPTLAGSALRVAARHGTRADFDVYKTQFENTETPQARRAFLGALGSFKDAAIQDEALKYVFGGELRPTELFRIPQMISSDEDGQARVYEWMTTNYDALTSRIPPEFAAYMPFVASGCSAERLKAARMFFDEPEHQAGGTLKNLAKVADDVTDCVNLRERDGARVAAYLQRLLSDRS